MPVEPSVTQLRARGFFERSAGAKAEPETPRKGTLAFRAAGEPVLTAEWEGHLQLERNRLSALR